MLIGYAKINAEEQSQFNKLDALIHAGVDLRNIYIDKINEANNSREKLYKMLEDLQEGDFVIIIELTKLCNSTEELFEIVDMIGRKRANIKSLNEEWFDTSTSSGRQLYTIIAGIAKYEGELSKIIIKDEPVEAKISGRAGGRPQKNQKDIDKAIKLYEDKNHSVREIEALTGVSKATLYRYLKQV